MFSLLFVYLFIFFFLFPRYFLFTFRLARSTRRCCRCYYYYYNRVHVQSPQRFTARTRRSHRFYNVCTLFVRHVNGNRDRTTFYIPRRSVRFKCIARATPLPKNHEYNDRKQTAFGQRAFLLSIDSCVYSTPVPRRHYGTRKRATE